MFAALLCTLSFPRAEANAAEAEPVESAERSVMLLGRAELGVGAPGGYLGMSAGVDILRHVAVEGTWGIGNTGLQLGGMVRARPPWRVAPYVGAGYALGHRSAASVDEDEKGCEQSADGEGGGEGPTLCKFFDSFFWSPAGNWHWLHLELGVEVRREAGTETLLGALKGASTFLVGIGAANLLAGPPGRLMGDDHALSDGHGYANEGGWYITIRLGTGFRL